MDMYQTTKWGEVSEDFLLDKKKKAKICSIILKISFLFLFLGIVCGVVYVLKSTEVLSVEFDTGLLFTALLVCAGIFLVLLLLSIVLRAAFGVFGLKEALEEAMEQEMEHQRQQEKAERRKKKKKAAVAQASEEPDPKEEQGLIAEERDEGLVQEKFGLKPEEPMEEEKDSVPKMTEDTLVPESAFVKESDKEENPLEPEPEIPEVELYNPDDFTPDVPEEDPSEDKRTAFPEKTAPVPVDDTEKKENPPMLCVVEKCGLEGASEEETRVLSMFADLGNSMKVHFAQIKALKTENENLRGEITRLREELTEEQTAHMETERMLLEAMDNLDKLQKVKRFSPGDDEAMHIEFLPDVELISLNMDIRIPTVPKDETPGEEPGESA